MTGKVSVIGGGLAGSEAAWQLARLGVPVVLHEMRPVRGTEAHITDGLAELVCSNSFRSDDAERSAIGLLHEEMRRCDSLILAMADAHKVPAGGALAVDREGFSAAVQAALEAEPLIDIRREEICGLPTTDPGADQGADQGLTIIATGPLTSPALTEAIRAMTGEDSLAFFDAIAPIVYKDSIDFTKAWMQSRYDKKGPGGDSAAYINCPLDRDGYEAFIDALLCADTTEFKDWEKDTPYFEGCLPIEVMAARGRETPRYGPMKPVGLTNPHAPSVKAHAIIQLRQDNALGTLYNIVGFQTKLRHGEQVKLLQTIPGLEEARFARLGGLHRNSFINAPKLLDETLALRSRPDLRFAGQITGVEGYIESAAMGLLAGRFTADSRARRPSSRPPLTTALGALLNHITQGADAATFQPMNVNFGLFPPFPERIKKSERKQAYCRRALADMDGWLSGTNIAAE